MMMEEDEESARYSTLVTMLEGAKQKKVKVVRVNVEGLRRTKTWLIKKHVATLLASPASFGDTMDLAQMVRSDLMRLDIFKSVEVEIDVAKRSSASEALDSEAQQEQQQQQQSDGGQDGEQGKDKVKEVEVTILVEEKRLVTGGTGVAVGQNEGSADFKINLVNGLGVGERLQVKSAKTSRGTTSYDVVMSWPLGGSLNTPLSIFASKVLEEYPHSSHKVDRHSVGSNVSFYTVFGHHTLQAESAWRNITGFTDSTSFTVREEAGHSLKNSLSHTLAIDLMNADLTEGATVKIVSELAGRRLGGDVHFDKHTAELAYKKPVFFGCEFAASMRAGVLLPQQGIQSGVRVEGASLALPRSTGQPRSFICDRFFLGGSLDVRGFQPRGIGARAKGDALGGDAFLAGALHLYTPFPYKPWRQRFGNALRTHVFVNAGAVGGIQAGPVFNTIQSLASNLSIACGAGLSIQTSLCTVEVNYTIPLQITSGSRPAPGLSFGIGFAFL